MASCNWNEAVGGAVFTDDEGRIVLVVLANPAEERVADWESLYPLLPIRQGIEDCRHRWETPAN